MDTEKMEGREKIETEEEGKDICMYVAESEVTAGGARN